MPGVPPVPIPNTAVKPRAANGSRTLGPARVGRCQVYGPVLRNEEPGLLFCLVDLRTYGPDFPASELTVGLSTRGSMLFYADGPNVQKHSDNWLGPKSDE
jgi:hypothetical protein